MSEVTATDEKLKPLVEATGGGTFWTRGGGLLSSVGASGVELPRISMLANARVLAGSGWLGLKDREAFVTRGVKLIPMFTGFLALAALLALLAADLVARGAVASAAPALRRHLSSRPGHSTDGWEARRARPTWRRRAEGRHKRPRIRATIRHWRATLPSVTAAPGTFRARAQQRRRSWRASR